MAEQEWVLVFSSDRDNVVTPIFVKKEVYDTKCSHTAKAQVIKDLDRDDFFEIDALGIYDYYPKPPIKVVMVAEHDSWGYISRGS